tara:strand:- start:2549 stop:3031 length:483 start_codon:yes stop_codon:yes gene_type:complete
MCSTTIPTERINLGYTICTECSTEEKKLGHIIYPHKTGAYIQVVDKATHDNLNRLDRRGTKGNTSKHYKSFSVEKPETTSFKNRKCNKVYTDYKTALKQVLDYYDTRGYEPTLEYLRKLNTSGDIALMTRVKIQHIIVEMYLNPTPRALRRKYKFTEGNF